MPGVRHSSPFRRHFVTEPAGQDNPIVRCPRPPLPSRSQLASSQLSISTMPPGRKAGWAIGSSAASVAGATARFRCIGDAPVARRLPSNRREWRCLAFRRNCVSPVGWSQLRCNRGGGERARTVDLRLAKPALSQLSYTPVPDDSDQSSETASGPGRRSLRRHRSSDYCFLITDPWKLVGQGGFEPPTSRLSSARSNQLSY